jgi:hypothetical protein
MSSGYESSGRDFFSTSLIPGRYGAPDSKLGGKDIFYERNMIRGELRLGIPT